MIEDFYFVPQDFADLIYIDDNDNDGRLRVRVLSRIEEDDDVYYLVSGQKDVLKQIECLCDNVVGHSVPAGHGIGYVHALELEPAHTSSFINLVEN